MLSSPISLVGIINALVPVRAFAQGLAQGHPEHAETLADFVGEIDRIFIELQASVYGRNRHD